MTREELVDELRDALSDACDMDTTFGMSDLMIQYVARVMARLATLSDEVLDEYRRLGETIGADFILGSDTTGLDLAMECEHEIAGRWVEAHS